MGQTVSFTSKEDSSTAEIFSVDGNIGFCCEPGVAPSSSGKATINKRYTKDDIITKVIYKYAVQGDYETSSGSAPSSGLLKKVHLQAMVQYCIRGDNAVEKWKQPYNGGWSNAICNAIVSDVEELRDKNMSIPDTLGVYRCIPADGSQEFVFYMTNDKTVTANLRLKKTSSNTSITG